jgi:ABC-2 type transport system permease protein
MLSKPGAFIRRDLGVALTYRLTFAESLFATAFGLASMDFVSRLVDAGSPPALEAYGNDYFAYSLVGVAIALFGQAAAGQFTSAVRGAQVTGTLEVIVGSRTSLPAFLAWSSLYGILFEAVRLAFVLIVGAVALDAHFYTDQLGTVALTILLTTAAFAGVGIFAAAFIVWFKQREPFTGLFMTASFLLGGVLYPTSVLPDWLERFAPLVPLSHTTAALRGALLQGSGLAENADELLALGIFALLLPLSLAVFNFAVRRAQAAGTLAHY